jgi:hypothetical protein
MNFFFVFVVTAAAVAVVVLVWLIVLVVRGYFVNPGFSFTWRRRLNTVSYYLQSNNYYFYLTIFGEPLPEISRDLPLPHSLLMSLRPRGSALQAEFHGYHFHRSWSYILYRGSYSVCCQYLANDLLGDCCNRKQDIYK